MFKLLLNYIRDQKNNWVQIIGLGFLVIIMITSFLSLTFGSSYVNDDYKNNVVMGEFHQDTTFSGFDARFKARNINKSWLENINYVTRGEDEDTDLIDHQKILNATFQLQKLPDEGVDKYLYRFYFEDGASNVHVGKTFAKATNHNYVDFKLVLPQSYHNNGQTHDQTMQAEADIINRFLYDPSISNPTNDSNKTNFFITNSTSALNYYNNSIKPITSYALRDYSSADINALAKLYNYLTLGMLWGDNIAWHRSTVINDLLLSGKSFAFVQTTPEDKINVPVLTADPDVAGFNPKNLGDNEILIYQEFAKKNNLKLGQNFLFSGYQFKIVGFATSSFAFNNNYYFRGVSDNQNQTVAFVNQTTFERISSDPFATPYNNEFFVFNPEQSAQQISPNIDNGWVYQYFHQALINDKTLDKSKLYDISNGVETQLLFGPLTNNYRFRTLEHYVWETLKKLDDLFIEIASIFLVLIFVVASVIIFIVVFKMIDRNKQLIGILKANGYQSWKLSVALVTAILFPIILFAIIAVALSVVISHFIVLAYASAMMLVKYGFPFYWLSSLLVIIIPILVLFIVSFLIVSLLLRVKPLTLINNSWAKNKYHSKVNNFFKDLSTKITKNFTFQNKLALTTTFRSFGKLVFVSLVSVFASTLLLFSFSATGLVNNMLGLQFASIDYRFNSQYKFTGQTYDNFIDGKNQLLYQKESTEDLGKRPSLYLPLAAKVQEAIENPNQPVMFDFRYGYIKGSELFEIRKAVEPQLDQWPEFKVFWNQNINWINYLTNNNGQNEDDLVINFGLLPYDPQLENPYTQMALSDPHDFNINTITPDELKFEDGKFIANWDELPGWRRTLQGVNQQSEKYLNPSLRNSSFLNFTNLTLENMTATGGWLNTSFLQTRQAIIDKFQLEDPEHSTVKIIPMVGSVVAGAKGRAGGDGNSLGKTVLYRYNSFNGREQYLIGVIYDGARNLLPGTVLMPEQWLKQALFSEKDNPDDEEIFNNLVSSFANSKFSNFDSNELKHYLPIISERNDYNIDLTKVIEADYLTGTKAIGPGLSLLYDVNSVKNILIAQQYSFQILIALFAMLSIVLSFMIIIIISNINIRDNLILINILRSLGYSSAEVSYIFLVVMMPLLVVFSLFAVLIAPFLTNFLAASLSGMVAQQIPIIFLWWYYAIPIFIIVLIYLISFIITWKLNVNNRQLMNLTK